jgi:hypothetical protein
MVLPRSRSPGYKVCLMPGTGQDPAGSDVLQAVPRRPFTGFDIERATYAGLKPELLAQAEGKYVAIVGDAVVGPLDSHQEAEHAGYATFGLGPLYIQQILAVEPVAEVTRLAVP